MPYLMNICFDNSCRLRRKYYLLEYRGVRFKLIQNNPRKWSDVLLTILPDSSQVQVDKAFTIASEFLSALSWKNRARVMMSTGGGAGVPDGYTLGRAKCRVFTFPRIPFGGHVVGFDIGTIPKIDTEEQGIALTLFREANGSNNDYLSFLFYWQVMETGGTTPDKWVDKAYGRKRHKLRLTRDEIARLPLGGKSLGTYLLDDCRHAIAHIKRKPGKKKLELDQREERRKLTMSTWVVKEFAHLYIRDVLNLKDRLYLVRHTKRSFPIYVDRKHVSAHHCVPAYQI